MLDDMILTDNEIQVNCQDCKGKPVRIHLVHWAKHSTRGSAHFLAKSKAPRGMKRRHCSGPLSHRSVTAILELAAVSYFPQF
jgi:hypothetical protein